MYLIKKRLVTCKQQISVSFERIVDDLLMISLVNNEYKGIPSYWRLTNFVGIPPLELGVDCKEGLIISATFFVDRSVIKNGNDIRILPLDGDVLVDTSIFKKTNEYIDVKQTYAIYYIEDKLICAFEKSSRAVNAFKNGRVEIFVNYEDQIIGFSICGLSEDERDVINNVMENTGML